ncbi:MAG TPA: secretin N-terminal domain-containing protein, partial [bacterium]|nr:secretin N-terminal domain-containing protein [bacterium]
MLFARSRLTQRFIRFMGGTLLCLTLAAWPAAGQQGGDPAVSDAVTFDFDAVDIRSFIKIVSELTGRNYVVDPAVTGQITVTSPQPVPMDAVDDVFQSVLNVYGFVAVSEKDIVKIVPAIRAREGGELVGTDVRRGDDTYVTRIFRLERADVNELRSVVSPLLSRAGHVSAHPGSRTLIITDIAGNVDRLEGIIGTIDGSGPELVQRIIALNHADAESVATAVTALYAAQPPASGVRPVIIAESLTNTLLIHAAKSDLPGVKKLISGLDVPRTDQRATLKVIRLRYADAASVASILNSQWAPVSGDGGRQASSSRNPGTGSAAISVTADTYSNALIVSASPEMLLMAETVIRDLDIPRRQILVEAMIVEMSSDLTRELGMEWRLTDSIDEDGTTAIGGTTFPTGSGGSPLQDTAANPLGLPPGMAFGIVDGTISWGGTTIANIAALARAMEGTSGVNVLSTPHLLTLDNEEAEIIVG